MSETPEILPASLAERSDEEIARALVDAPVNTDLARCAVASRIICTDNNPARWAAVCNLARTMLQADGLTDERRERDATLAVEEANGTRRKPAGTWDIAAVEELLAVAETQIRMLPRGERRIRLEELRLYHSGQAALLVGQFGRVAEYYSAAVAISATPFSVGLNEYLAAYYRLDQALVDGEEGTIQTRYEAFYAESEAFVDILDKSVEAELRWYGNVLCHRRRADRLCGNAERMDATDSLDDICALQPRAAFDDAVMLLGAVYLSRQGRRPILDFAYRALLRLAHDPGAEIEWRSLAHLFTAEIEEARGERETARVTFNALVNLEGHGGYVARAVARRKLAQLGG